MLFGAILPSFLISGSFNAVQEGFAGNGDTFGDNTYFTEGQHSICSTADCSFKASGNA